MIQTEWQLTVNHTNPELAQYTIESKDRPIVTFYPNFLVINKSGGEQIIIHEREVESISILKIEKEVPGDEPTINKSVPLVPLSQE